MKLEGRVWKFEDNVDTDLIIPARFLNVSDLDVLASNCFSDLRSDFAEAVKPGDAIVAGKNFGCGSSREHAPLAIKAAGIGFIIAKSFARIFYRNAFNIGLPIFESEEAAEVFLEGDFVAADMNTGELTDLKGAKQFFANPIPGFMRDIVLTGGIVPYVKEKGFSLTEEKNR